MTALLLLAFGCAGNIHELFEERKSYALETSSKVPSSWGADVSLRLSEPTVVALISKAIEDAIPEKKIAVDPMGSITPKLKLKKLGLTKASCDDCLGVEGTLKGTAIAEAMGMKTELPVTVKFTTSLKFNTKTKGKLRDIQLTVKSIDALKATVGTSTKFDVSGPLEQWSDNALSELEPMSLGQIGGDDLPMRDLRVMPDGEGLKVEVLTDAAHGAALTALPPAPTTGFQLVMSEETLLDYARRASFEQGEIAMEVYADPISMDVDGERFTMGLRLWRLAGQGWWRDYEITGTLAVSNKRIVLAADGVAEVAQSKGAGLSDPLAAIGEFKILEAIEEAAQAAIPVKTSMAADGLSLDATIKDAKGVGDALVISGTAELKEQKPGTKSGSKKTKSGGSKKKSSGSVKKK